MVRYFLVSELGDEIRPGIFLTLLWRRGLHFGKHPM